MTDDHGVNGAKLTPINYPIVMVGTIFDAYGASVACCLIIHKRGYLLMLSYCS
ncbi:hypothetical protein [Candidatus Nitrosocosmicus sp. SS]|uniref:hypothetical protein n=1 Tax=Candidatus Nitrosocosmicus agrestis TaxID=2563600 RepID=UPI0012B59C92|nr:hypothetical protein [Candidatus Nitrosocosmicus sp. SS]MDR4491578.1 hypothetical protein [Candidatus Nitrosocosmicus sp.]